MRSIMAMRCIGTVNCFWASLRPNLVLTNGVQIRPVPDSSVIFLAGRCLSLCL